MSTQSEGDKMKEKGPDNMLYCVGCGRAVAKSEPNRTLARACACGANAPILHTEAATVLGLINTSLSSGWATPASLLRGSKIGGPIPHLEYYLGFSDHESDLKTEVTRMLRALGAISYTECSDATCREAFERSKKRHQKWEERNKRG